MKKIKPLLMFLCITFISVNILANDNTIKFVTGGKIGEGIGAPILDLEYERNLIPFTSAYIRYGNTPTFDIPKTTLSDVSAKFSNFAFGARYNVLFFYIGAGYSSLSLSLDDKTSGSSASGKISGPTIEIGKKFKLGPISLGGSLGAQFANINIDFKNKTSFDLGKLKTDGNTTLINLEAFAGYSF
jgi:hypothetical protein